MGSRVVYLPAKDGDEHAVTCRYCRKVTNWRPNEAKKIKTRINQRERSVARRELRNSDNW